MTHDQLDTRADRVSPDIYAMLAAATSEQKGEIVLRLIEEHPEGRLELPCQGERRADLHQVDLSRETLKARLGAGMMPASPVAHCPAWWHGDLEGADLRRADLSGAVLGQANLRGAVLGQANLQGAVLGQAQLQDAVLWNADLREAELSQAQLQGAVLDDANLRGAVLWSASLQGAVLRQAQLQDAVLWSANLQGADLRQASLRGAELWQANLQEADLREADLTHIQIRGARLDRTRLRHDQLGGAIGEEKAGEYREARQAYLALKHNFAALGDYDGASWAYIKERQMEKLMSAPWQARRFYGASELGDSGDTAGKRPGRHRRMLWFYARHTWTWLADWLAELACGYGEKIGRTVGSILLVLAAFGATYWQLDGITTRDQSPPTFWDYLIFTLGALTASVPERLEARTRLVEVLMTSQAFVGIALTGLLGFVVGNRLRRS